MHVLVNKEKAGLWLHNNSYEGQRHIREQHVDYLALLMRDGLFRKGTLISFAVLGRRHYLINGYHTLRAIEKHNLEYELAVEDIAVTDMIELASLYASFDERPLSKLYTCHDTIHIAGTPLA